MTASNTDQQIVERPDLDEDVIKRYEENIALTDRYTVRPLRRYEDNLIAQGWMRGSNDELLSRSMVDNRNLTTIVTNELMHGYQHNGNIIIVIMGSMGDGKSTIGKSLALQIQFLAREFNISKNPQIKITFSNDETTRFAKQLKAGDILMQDEISRQMGTDSVTIRSMLFNLQEQLRMDQLSFIFISPNLKGMQNACNLILESWGMKKGWNRYRVMSARTERYLGWGETEYLIDTGLENYYNKRKAEHVAMIKRLQGASSVKWDKGELKKHGRKLLKATMKELGITDINKDTKKFFTKTNFMMGIACGDIEMAGSAKKQDAVAQKAMQLVLKEIIKRDKAERKIKKFAKKGMLPDSMSKTEIIRKHGVNRFHFILIEAEKNNKIVKKMFTPKYMNQFFKDSNPKKLNKNHIDAYKMHYIEGVDPSGVAKNFGKTRALMLNKYNKGGWLAIVDTEIIGYLAERAIKDFYFPKLNVYGGIEEPDLCDDIDNPTIMVEVKKRDEKKAPAVSMLSKKQIQHTINGYDSKLVILKMKGTEHTVETYDVITT